MGAHETWHACHMSCYMNMRDRSWYEVPYCCPCAHIAHAKVPQEVATCLVAAFAKEVRGAFGKNAVSKLESGRLIEKLANAHETGHASACRDHLRSAGLSASMPLSTKKLCDDHEHQVITPANYVRELAANSKLRNLTGGEPLKSTLLGFWERFQAVRPDHPALANGLEACACSVPILLFGDEGRALKKQAAMVLGWEPMLGFGCMTHCKDDPESYHGHKLNFDGSTYKTRMLYTIMHKQSYGSKKSGNKYLMSLIECWASDHAEAMHGVSVQLDEEQISLKLVPLGLKADWPAMVKLGQLKRSFYADAAPHGKGICHLCMANTSACPDYSGDSWKDTMDDAFVAPWNTMPMLVSRLCPGQNVWQQADFFRLDLFHICHKGVMAELAGSGLVSWFALALCPIKPLNLMPLCP